MAFRIPHTQRAVQLTGADRLHFNKAKEVPRPGPYQVLCRVEAVGLCFSDLKLLKQFANHVRKEQVVEGIAPEVLAAIPSYVPGTRPTVPGHETVVRVIARGEEARTVRLGGRYLVQTDYRWLRTPGSNAAFGYNFEGALQEYVLMDLRVITSPDGELMLIRVPDNLPASAVALVEPWACVEDAYSVKPRCKLKTDGRVLIVAEAEFDEQVLLRFLKACGPAGEINWLAGSPPPAEIEPGVEKVETLEFLPDGAFDDIVYFGCGAETVERLFDKLAAAGLMNVVLCGGSFDRPVTTPVGRVHYGAIRITGTASSDPADAMRHIPETGEIRPNAKINIVGAAGPMGTMHVIRNLCQGAAGVTVFAGDLDENRLDALDRIAPPLAEKNRLSYLSYNPADAAPEGPFDYTVIMVPRGELVADAVNRSAEDGIINIFAGIPADKSADIDLDSYIRRHLFFLGTSGSDLADMHTVLDKLKSHLLDTNLSVGAVCGLEAAVEGIRAVEDQLIPGKIVVYPACKGLKLLTLDELPKRLPQMTAALCDGVWTAHAEQVLLKTYR